MKNISNLKTYNILQILCDETGSNSECELGYCECDKQIVEDLRTEFDLLGSECPIDPGCPE